MTLKFPIQNVRSHNGVTIHHVVEHAVRVLQSALVCSWAMNRNAICAKTGSNSTSKKSAHNVKSVRLAVRKLEVMIKTNLPFSKLPCTNCFIFDLNHTHRNMPRTSRRRTMPWYLQSFCIRSSTKSMCSIQLWRMPWESK